MAERASRAQTVAMLHRRTLLTSALATLAAGRSSGATLTRAVVVPAGHDRTNTHLRLLGITPFDIKVSTADSAGALFVCEHRDMAKGGPVKHLHVDQDEWFYPIAGEFLFEVGEETFRLKAGDSLFAPRRVPHRWACVSEPGTIVIALQPAGKIEAFFKTIGALASRPAPEQLAAIFAAHGMRTLGPPLDIP
jgi:mannose-6-phosphate isomerase-like protein (cupin superfamily)